MAVRNPERLAGAGPINPANGFPRWFKDRSGRLLELALDPGDPLTPAMGDLPFPGAPVSFPGNFPDEAFYMLVEAELRTGGTPAPGRARLVLALEAAFGGTGAVTDGQQMVFGRVRVRIDGAIPNAGYVFTHPYGQTDVLFADDRGRVFVTEDIGTVPLAFTAVLESQVAPFLRWTSGAPAGYAGDGVTPHTITGSPLGTNFFAIEGPNIGDAGAPADPADPANINKIRTDLFTVQGRDATVVGVDITSATYARTAAGDVTIDVLASSEPGQQLTVAGSGMTLTGLRGAPGTSLYVARAQAPGGIPASIEVTNTTDDPPSVTVFPPPASVPPPVPPVPTPFPDAVLVARAEYDAAASTLTVEATSSDDGTPPLLTTDFGSFAGGTVTFPGVDAPPVRVEVRSAAGGSGSQAVTLTGAAMPPLPVVAVAGLDQAVQQTQLVTLDGGGSTGPVTGFTWAQTAGPAVVLSAPGAPVATFTAPGVAGPLTFALTVTGEGGPSSDEVTVQVSPVVALTADAGPGRAARLGERVTLDGTGSTGVAAFNWAQISGPPAVPIDAAGTATPAFPMPGGDVVLRLTAAGPAGPDVTSDVTITATPYVVTVQTAQFRTGRSEWRITGTATGALPDQVTVSFGGSVLGSSPVDATGAWDLRRTVLASEPALRPFPPASVTVTTTRGANQVVPVNIRS